MRSSWFKEMLVTGILYFLSAHALAAQSGLAGKAPRAGDFERLAEIFRSWEPAHIDNKKWMEFEAGPVKAPSHVHGWVIKEDAATYSVYLMHGETMTFQKPRGQEKRPMSHADSKPLSGHHNGVAWKVSAGDIVALSKEYLREAAAATKNSLMPRMAVSYRIVISARLALLAHEIGHAKEADVLFADACEAQRVFTETYLEGKPPKEELPIFVANHLARELRGDLIFSASMAPNAEPEYSFAYLQKHWEKAAAIPHSRYRDEAKEMVRVYSLLQEEDKRWVEPDEEAFARKTVPQQVAHWVYHLRKVNQLDLSRTPVRYWRNSWKSMSLKPNEHDYGQRAAMQLEELGVPAVPFLLAHLEDERLTRCRTDEKGNDAHLLSNADCCQRIIEQITGRTIFHGGFPLTGEQKRLRASNAERLWQDYQKKGELKMLAEGAARGDTDSVGQAEKLAKNHPDAALTPIIQGVRASKDALIRSILIQTADQLKDPKVVPFLLEELAGPTPMTRAEAAMALVDREIPAGVQSLLREWKQLKVEELDREESRWFLTDLLTAMIASRDPAAIRLLTKEMPALRESNRRAIVSSVRWRENPFSGAGLEALEELLVQAMFDSEVERTVMSSGSFTLRYPRLGDHAADTLAGIWEGPNWESPKGYDMYGRLQDRDRQRAEMKNVWLRKRGKEPEVIPQRRVEPLPQTIVQKLTQAVADAKTPAEKWKALQNIENLGLPALPVVRKLSLEYGGDAELKSLACRMGLIVREARFTADSVKPSESLARKLDSLRGRPLTDQALFDFVRAASNSPPAGSRGIQITLERIPDDTGIYFSVTLIADRPSKKGQDPQYGYGGYVLIDEELDADTYHNAIGLNDHGPSTIADIDWTHFAEKVRKAFDLPPSRYLRVQVECRASR